MKKLLFAAALFLSLSSFADPGIDTAMDRKFRESFPAASAIRWYDNKEGYEVFFNLNNIQCRIAYDDAGTMVHMRRDYGQDALPLFITGAINKKYPGKQIHGVTEITTNAGLYYRIVLQDEKNWYFVDANGGGNLYLDHKLRKS